MNKTTRKCLDGDSGQRAAVRHRVRAVSAEGPKPRVGEVKVLETGFASSPACLVTIWI